MVNSRCVFKCEACCGLFGSVVSIIAIICAINPKLDVRKLNLELGIIGLIAGMLMLLWVYYNYMG
jgi:hypothetical protein